MRTELRETNFAVQVNHLHLVFATHEFGWIVVLSCSYRRTGFFQKVGSAAEFRSFRVNPILFSPKIKEIKKRDSDTFVAGQWRMGHIITQYHLRYFHATPPSCQPPFLPPQIAINLSIIIIIFFFIPECLR